MSVIECNFPLKRIELMPHPFQHENLGQTTCNNGQGRVLYERLPNQQLQGFDDDVVRDTAPPFRVLEKCQDLCLRDRTASNNLVRACTSFDFQPGSRIASFSGSAEYEESTCYLTREQVRSMMRWFSGLYNNPYHFYYRLHQKVSVI